MSADPHRRLSRLYKLKRGFWLFEVPVRYAAI